MNSGIGDIERILQALGETLPDVAKPAGSYVPIQQNNKLLFVSGQLPMQQGKIIYQGKIPQDITINDAQIAAKLCGLNILSQVKAFLNGNWQNLASVIKLGGFVNCGNDFTEHAKIINGASELMTSVFGDAGKHARFAVGASSLPLNACVEVEAIFALK